jgi:Rieske Fe-S protein
MSAMARTRGEITSYLTISLPRNAGTLLAQRAAMDNPKTSRREFCAHAISLVTVASLIEGCGGKKGNPAGPGGGGGGGAPSLATVSGTRAGSAVTVNVGGTALATVGGAALVQAGSDSFLVTQTGSGSFSAFSAICTHEQCIVTGFQSGAFVCPCHGSQYSTSGQVVQGPATRALTRFNTQFTNNVLTITT